MTYLQIHRIFDLRVTVYVPPCLPVCLLVRQGIFSGGGEWIYLDVAQRHFAILLWKREQNRQLPEQNVSPHLHSGSSKTARKTASKVGLELSKDDLHGQTSSEDKRSPIWAARASSILDLNASSFLLSRLWLSISNMPRRTSCSRHPSLTSLGDDKHKSLASLSLFLIVWILRVASLPQTLYMSFTCPRCKLRT